VIVYTAGRSAVRLGAAMGRGGEATVYRVQGRDEVLAKLYTKPRPEAEEKLGVMRASPPADPTRTFGHASIAWPQDLLFDNHRRFVGYLMPHIRETVPVLEVFNPRRRGHVLPAFDLAYLHRTARNLASALAALHARGYVVGDLNERNVLVTPRALVTLIDCDSFQVEQASPGKIVTYPCPVGRLEYTPPELQGQAFRSIRRDTEHDCFGLGVLIFQLLMEGNHPFRSQWLGEGEPPPVETKIAHGLFPWAPSPAGPAAPPPGTPDPAAIHPAIADAILRCFVEGHRQPRLRPTADEWSDALAEAEQALAYCRNGHCYSGHLKRCPVCNARRDRQAMPAEAPAPARQAPTAPAPGGGSAVAAGSRSALGVGGRPGAPAAPDVLSRVIGTFGLGGNGTRPASGHGGQRPVPRAGRAAVPASPARAGPLTSNRLAYTLPWAAVLAIAGAGVAVASGALLAAIFDPLLAPPVGTQTTPAGLWAAVIGGAALTIVGVFRVLEHAPDYRFNAPLVRAAATRGGASLGGWATGWVVTGAVFTTLGLNAPSPTAFAQTFGVQAAGGLSSVAGWTLAWVIYGAIGGTLGGLVRDRPAGWGAVGAVFGAAGWLAVRVAAALWVGTG